MIYRGFELKGNNTSGFGIYDETGKRVASASNEELAYAWIDAEKKRRANVPSN